VHGGQRWAVRGAAAKLETLVIEDTFREIIGFVIEAVLAEITIAVLGLDYDVGFVEAVFGNHNCEGAAIRGASGGLNDCIDVVFPQQGFVLIGLFEGIGKNDGCQILYGVV
jgi:hypothetical protein